MANADGLGSPMDASIGADILPALIDASDASDSPASDAPLDFPMVADASVELPRSDAPLNTGGATCQSGGECASTYCVDGVCCEGACTGQCQACAETNKVGTCTTVSGAPRGTRAACAATQATCGGACAGSLPSQCSYPASETTCAGASCSGDLALKTASVCNGAGACTASSVVSCDSGKYCTGGACVIQITNGGSCQNGNQCTSGNCSNSLCCATGQTGCGSSCVSLSTSNANCGTCGRSCAAGSSCSGGSCYLAVGQSCTTGGQCLSGVCSTFYFGFRWRRLRRWGGHQSVRHHAANQLRQERRRLLRQRRERPPGPNGVFHHRRRLWQLRLQLRHTRDSKIERTRAGYLWWPSDVRPGDVHIHWRLHLWWERSLLNLQSGTLRWHLYHQRRGMRHLYGRLHGTFQRRACWDPGVQLINERHPRRKTPILASSPTKTGRRSAPLRSS